ncbi:MAG TPA: hypothetical protein DCM73_02250 [Clostridiales bacterium]|nr:hypothetical protein [Clostridiales bacterium]
MIYFQITLYNIISLLEVYLLEYLSNRSTWIYIVALILLVTLFSFKVYAMPEGLVFTDIKGHENENIIKKWSDFNIISGYDNNTFMPDRYITRAEFSVIIDNILKSTNFNNYIYLDAFPGEWHYIPLSKAVSKGILKPYENRIFPMEYITKKEALDAIKAAFGISSSNEPLAINESITRSGLLKELDNLIGKIYSSPGSYSFDFPLEGSIIVNSPNVSLNNVHINGNLIITESASALSISNVSANGKIIILGKTNTELSSPEPLNINFTGPDGNIYVYGNYADISLSGNLNTLVLNTPNSRINLLSGKINSINLNGNSNINISGSASINKISSSSPHSIILNNTENISEISENIKISGTNSNKAKEEPNKPSIISSSDSEDYNEDIPSPSNENNQNPPHKAEKFNIIFNANGGKFKNNASKLEFQLEIDSKLYFSMVGERPTKNGFSFKGWALEKDSSEGIDDGFPISSDITLFAVWEKMPDPVFTVSFDANGGVFEDDLEILDFQLNKNSPLYFSIADQNPTKGGFSFKGWAFERDSSEDIDDGFPVSSDITLFAIWEKMPEPVFTVSFDANGGVFEDDLEILDFQLNKDSVLYFSIIDKRPTKDGFSFKGWAFEKDASEGIVDGFSISSDIIFFAIWEKNNIEDGSYATPFIINSPYDFLSIGSDTGEHEGWKMNSCYKINFDIDMAGINFSPIGSKDKKFTGVLMGNGKNIINIRLNSNELYQGLFSYLGNSGVIENLNISFDEIKISSSGSGNVFFGGIAGYNEGNIKNCRVEISDFNSEITYNSKTAFYAGGVAGNNAGNIEHASAYFNITSASGNSYIGGISGYSSGNIGASSSEFNIEITKKGGTAYTGGITGNNESIISNSYSRGTLSISGVGVDNFAGLLAGNNNGTIKNAYTEGNIISQIIRTRSCLGAIAGYNNGNIENCVTIAEKISSVFIDKLHIKRISGYNAASKGLLNNYALNTMILEVEGEAVDITSNKNEEHGESISIESIEDKSFFNTIGWDFDIWTWDSEIKRPVIIAH